MRHVPVAKPSPIPRWSFPRRGLAIAFVLVGFVALVAVVGMTAYPVGSKIDDGPHWETIARADQLEAGQPYRLAAHRLWLVKLQSGEVLALSSKDPRNGALCPGGLISNSMGAKAGLGTPATGRRMTLRASRRLVHRRATWTGSTLVSTATTCK